LDDQIPPRSTFLGNPVSSTVVSLLEQANVMESDRWASAQAGPPDAPERQYALRLKARLNRASFRDAVAPWLLSPCIDLVACLLGITPPLHRRFAYLLSSGRSTMKVLSLADSAFSGLMRTLLVPVSARTPAVRLA
jgi:hypothetical protein